MKRRIALAILTALAALCLCFAFAACGKGANTETGSKGTEGLQYRKYKDEAGKEYVAVVGLGTAEEADIVIPSVYEGLPVKEIGESAFDASIDERNASLTSISIPNSVTSIGYLAFYDCSRLTYVTIGSGVTSIGSLAFLGCSRLKEVHISDLAAWCGIEFGESGYDKAASNPLSRAHHLFMDYREITKLKIPNGVTSIGNLAFSGCSSLTSIEIPNSVISIGEEAFEDCSGLTGELKIPDGVTSIGSLAFSGCGMEKFIVGTGNAVYSSQDGVLYDKGQTQIIFVPQAIKGAVAIPNGVSSIEERAFSGRGGLTEITIPGSVTSIGYEAFSGCSGLTSVAIESGVTSIESSAFEGCSRLAEITIPESVTSIGYWAFSRCRGLAEITIPDSVTSIGNRAFSECSGLTFVTIGNSVTSIGERAFEGCSNLQSVIFRDPNGWSCGGTEVDSATLQDPARAAEYLLWTHVGDEWKKETSNEGNYIRLRKKNDFYNKFGKECIKMNKKLCCYCDKELTSMGRYYVCHHCKTVAFIDPRRNIDGRRSQIERRTARLINVNVQFARRTLGDLDHFE